ncbi:MAG: heavy-metal-associated domain-containing protein [Solobacterium sp.]|nr:heavy-metal-associated domain-containing protein [Solobacterium sp.]
MNIPTLVIILILVVIAVFAVRSMMQRAESGCCSPGDKQTVKKVKVADTNKANYPYEAVLTVDGMTCSGCAQRVDNALNSVEGIWASTDLSAKKTLVRMKKKYEEKTLRDTVNQIGPYTVMSVEWKS